MATDVGVREALRRKGYSNQDIGFDKGTGYVQLKGQNFLKPEMNVNGTTFTSEDNFNTALNQFNNNQQRQQTQELTDQLINNVTNPEPIVNPYANQFNDLIADIQNRMNQPAPNVYSTPQYAAAQAQADRAQKQQTRAAQEAFGSAGFGRSTGLGERVASIAGDANEYLQTQLVPQILNQLQAQRQQEIANQFNLLAPITTQLNREDTLQRNRQNDLANIVEFLTGRQDRSQDIQREDQQLADERAYRDARDAIMDERYKIEFDEDVRQRGLDYALEKARLSNQISQQNIDNALQRERFEFDKEQAQKQEEESNGVDIGEEKRGLTTAIRTGELTPGQALQQIQEDRKLGFYTDEEVAILENTVQQLASFQEQPQTEESNELQEEILATIPSDKEIEAEARKLGYPTLDYRSYYKDPKGKSAGLSFDQWVSLYGPSFGPG